MPLPPTPKPDELGNGRILPNAPDARLRLATGNSGPVTPPVKSPTMGKEEKAEGEKSTHTLPLGQNQSPPQAQQAKLGLGAVAEVPETDSHKAMDVDGKDKGDLPAPPSVPLPAARSESIDEPPKKTGAVGEEIGLHCWIIGILQEEVDMAVEKVQALFDAKISMFEQWARENEFDPIWFDEESDSDDDSDDEDEGLPKKGDVEMKEATPGTTGVAA